MPTSNPEASMEFTTTPTVGAASTPIPDDVKKKLQDAVRKTIKEELAKPENGGISAAGHAKSSISW